MKPLSLYIHIPFCLQRCQYCDFNTYALTTIPEKEYISALLAELDFRAASEDFKGREIQTIYFGGGTPSLLKPASIAKILRQVRHLFPVAFGVEISMEGNPGTVSPDSLKEFRSVGVNRISFGAQSFDPDLLKTLGRIDSPDQTEAAVLAARAAGFENLGLDLIYGIPGQTREQLTHDLREIVRLSPQHVSAYGLTVEKGTPFFSQCKKGKLTLPSEDEVLEMMSEVNHFLPGCGYKRYEISNYAETGYEAKHNLVYWNGGDYLGLGAGAHSLVVTYEEDKKVSAKRWANHKLPNKYIREAVAHGQAQDFNEDLGAKELIFEFFFLGFRKIAGVSASEFEKYFGAKIEAVYPAILEVLSAEGLIEIKEDNLHLTEKGLLLADSVIENFACPEKV